MTPDRAAGGSLGTPDAGTPEAGPGFFWGCALAFAVTGLALLWPVLDGGFFGDDWSLYLASPASHVAGAFAEARPFATYRPIQLLLVASSQALWGDATLPVHLLNLALHVLLALLVVRALLALGAPRAGAALGGLYLCVSQLAGSAVGGNDTISLTLGTAAGSAALYCLRPFAPVRALRPGLAALALAVALFAKESSMGYVPVLAGLAWLHLGRSERDLRRLARWLGGIAAVTLFYLAARAHAGAVVPDVATNPYVGLGPHVLVNVARLGFAALVPVSTTRIFLGLAEHRWLWPAAGVALTVALFALFARGMARAQRLAFAGGCAGAALVLMTPVLLLVHVSELYAYGLVPLAALLFGWSAGVLVTRGSAAERRAALALAALVLAANAAALREDAQGMAQNGLLARQLLPQVVEHVRALPRGGTAVLVDPPPEIPNYSVFQMSGFASVRLWPESILELTGRDDVQLLYVLPGEAVPECPGCTFLTLAPGNRIVPMP